MVPGDWQSALGFEALDRGAVDEGLAYFLASSSANPHDAGAHFEAGYLYDLKGDFDRAIEQTQAAVALDPNVVDAHNNLGRFLEQRGRYPEAAAQFQEALTIAPGNVLAQYNLGAARFKIDLINRGAWQDLISAAESRRPTAATSTRAWLSRWPVFRSTPATAARA